MSAGATPASASSNIKPMLIEAAICALPLALVATYATDGNMTKGITAGAEGAVAHTLGLMFAGSSYGKDSENKYYLTADDKEAEVAVVSGLALGAYVYFKDMKAPGAMAGALRTGLLVAAMSYLGSQVVLPRYNDYMKSA
jgi:hypothetical protein